MEYIIAHVVEVAICSVWTSSCRDKNFAHESRGKYFLSGKNFQLYNIIVVYYYMYISNAAHSVCFICVSLTQGVPPYHYHLVCFCPLCVFILSVYIYMFINIYINIVATCGQCF